VGGVGREPPAWQLWMQAAQQGDRERYAMLLHAVIPILGRAARSNWPRAPAADIEDAVQETLLAFHAARHMYDPARPVLPFLLGILRFRGADVIRRRRRVAVNEAAIEDMGETFEPIATDISADDAVDGATLRDAITRLPPQQRQALEIMKLQGMSLREASAATGISVVALKVATHRAIQSLRKLLGGSA